MITKKSLNLAEMLIDKPGFIYNAPDLIQSLSDDCVTSFGVQSTNARDLKEELVKNSVTNAEHGELVEEASNVISGIIRNSLNDIKNYASGLASVLRDASGEVFSEENVRDSIEYGIGITFVPTTSELFDSKYYPSGEVQNKLLDFKSPIQIDGLSGLETDYLSFEELLDLLALDNEELRTLLINNNVYSEGLGLKQFLFNSLTRSGESINFNAIGPGSDQHCRTLVAYLLVVKLSTMDEIPEFVKNISLENYRNLISICKDGLATQLALVRKAMTVESVNGLRIVTNKEVTAKTTDGGALLTGDVKVYFSDTVLEEALANKSALRSLIIGYYYATVIEKEEAGVNKIRVNMDHYKNMYKNYLNSYTQTRKRNLEKLLRPQYVKAIIGYVTSNPALNKRVQDICDSKNHSLNEWVNNTLGNDLESLGTKVFYLINGPKVEDCDDLGALLYTHIAESSFITSFLRAVGSHTAAKLLDSTSTTVEGEDTVTAQRERLSVAVINYITELVNTKSL